MHLYSVYIILYIYIHKCMYIYTHMRLILAALRLQELKSSMWFPCPQALAHRSVATRITLRIYVYIYIYVCISVSTYVYIQTYIYIYMWIPWSYRQSCRGLRQPAPQPANERLGQQMKLSIVAVSRCRQSSCQKSSIATTIDASAHPEIPAVCRHRSTC